MTDPNQITLLEREMSGHKAEANPYGRPEFAWQTSGPEQASLFPGGIRRD